MTFKRRALVGGTTLSAIGFLGATALAIWISSQPVASLEIVMSADKPKTVGHYTSRPGLVHEGLIRNTSQTNAFVPCEQIDGFVSLELRGTDGSLLNSPVGDLEPSVTITALAPGEQLRATGATATFVPDGPVTATVRFEDAHSRAVAKVPFLSKFFRKANGPRSVSTEFRFQID